MPKNQKRAQSKALARTYGKNVPWYYAVHKGTKPGVYLSWEECIAAGNEMNRSTILKSFMSKKAAHMFWKLGYKTSFWDSFKDKPDNEKLAQSEITLYFRTKV